MATIVITGANRGIGLALTRRLVGRGDQVIGTCRSEAKALKELGVRVESAVDVRSDEAVQGLATRLSETPVDWLILNAGILHEDSLDQVRLSEVVEQLQVNSIGPLRVVLALRKNLHRGSKVGIITSRMGSIGDNTSGGYYGYRMSKAAVNAMGASLAFDLKSVGVAVAILHPGAVRTEMTGGFGNVDADESARLLIERMDALSLETSGTFWHASGAILPW